MRLDSDKIEEMLYRENLKIAPFSKRALAYLIDDLLIALIFFIMFFSQFSSVRGNELALMQLVGSLSIYAVILRFFYQSIFTYLYGASIGKMIMRIKILQIDSLDSPDMLNALARSFFKEIGQALMYITYFFAINDPLVRTLHDRIVKSVVIMQD